MQAHDKQLRTIRRQSVRALGLLLLTLCVVFPTLANAAPAEDHPEEADPQQRTATPRVQLEVKHATKDEHLELSIQHKSPALSLKPIADPPTTKALPTGENKTGVSSQSISVPKGPGTIEGMGESFSAQASTGIATFAVPFALKLQRRGDMWYVLGAPDCASTTRSVLSAGGLHAPVETFTPSGTFRWFQGLGL